MNYIDNDDYWAKTWQLEAESEYHFLEKQRIELQNAAGVDMPFIGEYSILDFVDCIFQSVDSGVPF